MFFFFNDTATTEIYTLSLHDALPISVVENHVQNDFDVSLMRFFQKYLKVFHAPIVRVEVFIVCYIILMVGRGRMNGHQPKHVNPQVRSEEHTSELQSPVPISYAVFCLKKKK